MNVLPLFTQPSHPDAWHRVAAPGGYEGWYIDAEDATGRLRIVASFHEGFVFHPGYLRRYAAYLRRPERRSPPRADEYPVVCFSVYGDGGIIAQYMAQFPASSFAAEVYATDVRIGPNRLSRAADGSLRLQLRGTPWKRTWRGPRLIAGEELSADLSFRPRNRGGAMERPLLSRRLSGAEHHWLIADPLCDVTGTIDVAEVGQVTGTISRRIAFAGRGYHDHLYGTAPIGAGIRRWIRGRAIAEDRTYLFHFVAPRDAQLPDEIQLIRADAAGRTEAVVSSATVDWSRRTALGLAYPREIHFPRHLHLTSPKIVDSTMCFARLAYEAQIEGGRRTSAFCEVTYPHRLRCPILGRLIEMSISRNARPVPSSGTAGRE